MRRAADSDCAEDALSVLGLLEATGRYRVVHDRLPSNSSAAGVRPKRSGRPRRVRTAPVTEDKDSLKLQQQVKLRVAYVKHSAWHGANSLQDVHASQVCMLATFRVIYHSCVSNLQAIVGVEG